MCLPSSTTTNTSYPTFLLFSPRALFDRRVESAKGPLLKSEEMSALLDSLAACQNSQTRIGRRLDSILFGVIPIESTLAALSKSRLTTTQLGLAFGLVFGGLSPSGELLCAMQYTAERLELARMLRAALVDPDRSPEVLPVLLTCETLANIKAIIDTIMSRNS
jgi:exopolyphosphatase/pppGpp-phosphohydrolase